MKRLLFTLGFILFFSSIGCKRAIVRDRHTYQQEVEFFRDVFTSNEKLLITNLKSSGCSCDKEGQWNTESCEETANMAIFHKRLYWHLDMMLHLGGIGKKPQESPEITDEDMQVICDLLANVEVSNP